MRMPCWFRLAKLLASSNALVYRNIGSVYLQLGRRDEAVTNCLASFRLIPGMVLLPRWQL